jgi:hypothetical protein
MEEDFNLYRMIINSVETQIKTNNPPATRETFERLKANGHDEEKAKEMIASIIAEEIYLMVKDEKEINEDMFARRLSKLE